MANELFTQVKSKSTGTLYNVADARLDDASFVKGLVAKAMAGSQPAVGILKLAEFNTNEKTVTITNVSGNAVSLMGMTIKGWDEEGAARPDHIFSFSDAEYVIPANGLLTISTQITFGYGLSGRKAWKFELIDANGVSLDVVNQTNCDTNKNGASDGKIYVAATQTWVSETTITTPVTTVAPATTTAAPATTTAAPAQA